MPTPETTIAETVQRCCTAYYAALAEESAREVLKRDIDRPRNAYRNLMPFLSDPENIRAFIACVAHGMLIGAIYYDDGSKLLYAAQVARSALPREPRPPANSPKTTTPSPLPEKHAKSTPTPSPAPTPQPGAPSPSPSGTGEYEPEPGRVTSGPAPSGAAVVSPAFQRGVSVNDSISSPVGTVENQAAGPDPEGKYSAEGAPAPSPLGTGEQSRDTIDPSRPGLTQPPPTPSSALASQLE